jgi:hypothetical protein
MKTNSILATAYQGRNNALRLSLGIDGQPVDDDIITRAIISLELTTSPNTTYCLDTEKPSDSIELLDSATVLRFYPGLIPDIALGDYQVWITVYDGLSPEGLAWGAALDRKGLFYEEPALYLRVARWPACST